MTLHEFFSASYTWAVAHRTWILVAAVAVPLVGTLLARVGKAGKTDRDGRFIASVVVGVAVVAVLIEVAACVVGHSLMQANLLHADVLLLLAPVVCLAGALFGIRLVFPLNQLGSVRTLADVGAFLVACAAVVWFFSKFRGWGLLFFGNLSQLVLILVLGFFLVRRLYRRAFGAPRAAREAEPG